MRMGRVKIAIKRIENRTNRQVTFSKRRAGLLKKTHELSVLCDAHIGLIIFSTTGKLYQYCTETTSMEEIIRRYQIATGMRISENIVDPEQMHGELRRIKKEIHNHQLSLQRYMGDDLSSVQYDQLLQLEHQLENSVNKVRARKFELLEQQMDNLRRKERMLEEENEQMFRMIKVDDDEQGAAWKVEEDSDQRHHVQVLDHFPFSGEAQPSSVLELAINPHHFPQSSSFRLQPAQPNLQDFTLHCPNYAIN
ncbi:hypothetical protein LWI28_028638 [Acer negundo]|uniref:MADS-box protein FBP24 n=1 Tax=Acer negundo TaxID=4023 RepID=A0AAD5P421_ACENE|nr:hypothetical protein LWI28_028638 [Acer negundo]